MPERDLLFHLGHHAAEGRAALGALLQVDSHSTGKLRVELAGEVGLDIRLNFGTIDVAAALRTFVGATKLLHRQTADKEERD